MSRLPQMKVGQLRARYTFELLGRATRKRVVQLWLGAPKPHLLKPSKPGAMVKLIGISLWILA